MADTALSCEWMQGTVRQCLRSCKTEKTGVPVVGPEDVSMVLDYAGVAVFAATGALAAAKIRGDIITFAFFAAVTGVGGGTLRDLLLDVPVFWVRNPGYVAVCLAMAVLVWFTGGPRWWREQALLWLDAVGLAGYAILGASKALAVGVHPLIAAIMGMLTACFGGVIRDVLARESSSIIKREIYVSAAILGAGSYAALVTAGLPARYAMIIAFLAAFLLRGGAMLRGWHLPAFPDPVAPRRERLSDKGDD